MELSHCGQRIDCQQEPIEGSLLALNASNGAGSKNKAWMWADDAVAALSFKSEILSKELKKILENTKTNFPNANGGLEFVKKLMSR